MYTQVRAHPCDRDYQHTLDLPGCSPVFPPSGRTQLGLVDMRARQRVVLPKDVQHGTYAQTIKRDGYINMLGRPPFDYSTGSPMRKSGFMSADTLLGPSGDKTIFKPCKTVEQCFMDTFTHRGMERTRRVFIEGDAFSYSLPSFMRDWKPSDATKCGIFGVLVEDPSGLTDKRKCPGLETNSNYYCCMVDAAVVPLFHLFQENPQVLDELDGVCNRPFSPTLERSSDTSYPIFSKTKIQSLVQGGRFSNGKYYAVLTGASRESTIKMYSDILNDLLHEFSPPPGE
jgi:hypothetical protein